MTRFPRMALVLLGLVCGLISPGLAGAAEETFPTANFLVTAPDHAMAVRIGREAERLRKEKAVEWFGAELPRWPQKCAVTVTLSFSRGRCYTTLVGRVPTEIVLEGPYTHLLGNVLPHEITHAVMRSNLDFELPCWADEGAAVLSSSQEDRQRHDEQVHHLASDRRLPLPRLFDLMSYPEDYVPLYAQGYSVTRFLVTSRDRKTFLAFVTDAQTTSWDRAAKKHYGFEGVNALEAAWRKTIRWTGRPIYCSRSVKLRHTDSRTQQVMRTATLSEGIYRVRGEQGDWIKVVDRDRAGWIEKDEAQLVEFAVARLTRRIAVDPGCSRAHAWRALAWREQGQLDQAMEDLDAAVALAPDEPAWYLYRGQLALQQRHYRRAAADLCEATWRLARRAEPHPSITAQSLQH